MASPGHQLQELVAPVQADHAHVLLDASHSLDAPLRTWADCMHHGQSQCHTLNTTAGVKSHDTSLSDAQQPTGLAPQ